MGAPARDQGLPRHDLAGGPVPEFHCTFNLTPVLLKQIQQLANEEVRDLWHELAAPAPETLTVAQKASLLEHFLASPI